MQCFCGIFWKQHLGVHNWRDTINVASSLKSLQECSLVVLFVQFCPKASIILTLESYRQWGGVPQVECCGWHSFFHLRLFYEWYTHSHLRMGTIPHIPSLSQSTIQTVFPNKSGWAMFRKCLENSSYSPLLHSGGIFTAFSFFQVPRTFMIVGTHIQYHAYEM